MRYTLSSCTPLPCTLSPCTALPTAGLALASALPRRRSLRGRPCQGTAVRDLVALRASRSRAATPHLHPRTPEPRASLARIALLLTRLNPPCAPLLVPGRSPPLGSRSCARTPTPPAPRPPLPCAVSSCARRHAAEPCGAATSARPAPVSVPARALLQPLRQHRHCSGRPAPPCAEPGPRRACSARAAPHSRAHPLTCAPPPALQLLRRHQRPPLICASARRRSLPRPCAPAGAAWIATPEPFACCRSCHARAARLSRSCAPCLGLAQPRAPAACAEERKGGRGERRCSRQWRKKRRRR
jgi:hypothetical protein